MDKEQPLIYDEMTDEQKEFFEEIVKKHNEEMELLSTRGRKHESTR